MKLEQLLEKSIGKRRVTSHASSRIRTTVEFEQLLEWARLMAARVKNNLPRIERLLEKLRGRGEKEKRINALDHWRQSLVFTERERAAISLGEAISLPGLGVLSSAILQEARGHFSNDELIRLALTVMADNHQVDFNRSN